MDNKKIGSFLYERRKSLELTQQQLADRIGVSNKAVSKWETGEGYPDISTIPELCAALSISTDDFFYGGQKAQAATGYNEEIINQNSSNNYCVNMDKDVIMLHPQKIVKKVKLFIPIAVCIALVCFLLNLSVTIS